MKTRFLLSLSLSAVSLALALDFLRQAAGSLVKSPPVDPLGAVRFAPWLGPAYFIHLQLYTTYQRDLLSAGGLAVFAAVLLLWELGHHGPEHLRRVVMASLLFASSFFFLSYLCLAAADSSWPWLMPQLTQLPAAGSLINWTMFSTDANYGYLAAVAFVDALVGLTLAINSLGRNWLSSFRAAIAVFAVPGVLFLEVGLFLFQPSTAPLYVANFARWTYGGVYILSNWNVLLAALGIGVVTYGSIMFGAVRRKLDHQKTRQNQSHLRRRRS